MIVDAQSVKNTDTAGFKGYDAGKKVSGIKRHIAVDTLGLPHAIAVTTANVTDRQGALQAFERCKASLSAVQVVLTDAGYTGNPFATGVKQLLGEHVQVQIAKRSELHRFEVMPKRSIVERSFAWLEKNRRLWKNCERWLNTSLQFIHLAFVALLLRRSQTRSYKICQAGILMPYLLAMYVCAACTHNGCSTALRAVIHRFFTF